MKQESFSDMEYRCRKKKTKREEFLEIMIFQFRPCGEAVEHIPRQVSAKCLRDLAPAGIVDTNKGHLWLYGLEQADRLPS